MTSPNGIQIEHPVPRRRREALEVLLGGSPGAVDRFLAYADSTGLSLDGLWSAFDGGNLVASVFVTSPRSDAAIEPVAALVDHAARHGAELDVSLVQALVEPGRPHELAAFERGGLRRIAMLRSMERPRPRKGEIEVPPLPPGLVLESFREGLDADTIEALERSYIDTLDCPGLTGLRRGEDILAGHRGAGRLDPSLWTLVRARGGSRAGRVVATCLMNPQPASAAVELVYLGIDPDFRGKGLGGALLARGLDAVSRRSERRVTLAVDDRNLPALALYRRFGFRGDTARAALVRPVGPRP
jgi:ribosomal protein S18 acetylase RimI-like enzyme